MRTVAREIRFLDGLARTLWRIRQIDPDSDVLVCDDFESAVDRFADHTACFLDPTRNAGTSKASQAFWQVDDVEREVAELKKRGVVFENYDEPDMKTVNGIMTSGMAKAAWFKDSEGNIMAIIQDVR